MAKVKGDKLKAVHADAARYRALRRGGAVLSNEDGDLVFGSIAVNPEDLSGTEIADIATRCGEHVLTEDVDIDAFADYLGGSTSPASERGLIGTVFYGPHPCKVCERMICMQAVGEGGNAFDYPEAPIYPNTYWPEHRCPGSKS